jgi:hypothetical protein
LPRTPVRTPPLPCHTLKTHGEGGLCLLPLPTHACTPASAVRRLRGLRKDRQRSRRPSGDSSHCHTANSWTSWAGITWWAPFAPFYLLNGVKHRRTGEAHCTHCLLALKRLHGLSGSLS